METPAQASDNPVTGNAPLYINPEPLNPAQHGKLGVSAPNPPYAFGRNQHFFPLLAPEFLAASCCYPIIFAGPENMPLAIMGLNPGENIFYENDVIRPDVYLPAYLRRYPFTTALDAAADRMVICIDRGAPFIGERYDQAFFEKDQPTQYTQQCIDFCQNYEADRSRTLAFVQALQELDLLEHREAKYTPIPLGGQPAPEPQVVAGFNAVSEAKLNALSGDDLVRLRDTGYLHVIYAHLTSMLHWDRLIAMTLQRRANEAAAQEAAQAEAAKIASKKKN